MSDCRINKFRGLKMEEKKKVREIMDKEFAKFKITKENLDSKIRSRSAIRPVMGKWYTTDEWEKKRKKVLETPLH